MKKVLLHLIEQYRIRAAAMAKAGLRPVRLPCEHNGFSSEEFADTLKSKSLVAAISNMMHRCPHGRITAIKALSRSFGYTLVPVAAFAPPTIHGGPSFSPVDEPCFAGSPAEC